MRMSGAFIHEGRDVKYTVSAKKAGAAGGGGGDGSDDDNDSSSSEDEDSDHTLQENDGENSCDEEEAAEEPEETGEEQEWFKEFEMMQKALHAKKEPERKARPVKRVNVATHKLHEPDDFLVKFEASLRGSHVQTGAKAHRCIDMLEDLFARSWIYARHLALIVECFHGLGYIKQTKFFGTYRVDLVIALFSRVVDLHNFEFVLEVMSPFEVACLYCRLGWLNLFNPCKPEGAWELDMARRDERIVCKMLCCLATHEPGDNWMRSMESMPGWELTQPWLTEEGMPLRGLVNISYYSGEGQKKKGCKPYVSFRKSLLNLVLIREEEIVSEDVRSKPPPAILPGDRAFQKHINPLWECYLAPEWVDPNRKR